MVAFLKSLIKRLVWARDIVAISTWLGLNLHLLVLFLHILDVQVGRSLDLLL